MNRIVLNEQEVRNDLFPFTRNRSVVDLRVGILTLREKWKQFGYDVKMAASPVAGAIPANIIPTNALIDGIDNVTSGNSKLMDDVKLVKHPWDIFHLNGDCIKNDFLQITKKRNSEAISPTNQVINPANVFIEKGAKVEYAILNALTGPIYIGKNAEVMEGSMIRGPFAL